MEKDITTANYHFLIFYGGGKMEGNISSGLHMLLLFEYIIETITKKAFEKAIGYVACRRTFFEI